MNTYIFPKKTIKDIEVKNKRILLRADFNVPQDDDGQITSDFRMTQTLPTLHYLLKQGCTIIIIAHLGRPDGKRNEKLSLHPIYAHLKELLPGVTIQFAADTVGDLAWQTCKQAPKRSIVLLENLRFDPGEEANDPEFAGSLKRVSGADYFVQDAFGVVHRAHASTEAITHLLPSVAGLLLAQEVTSLESVMLSPAHPLVAVIGGAKISDKIGFIERLLKVADTILIGGAMANTFLKQQGHGIGKSLYEPGQQKEIATILQKAKPDQVILPIDVGVATELTKDSHRHDRNLDAVQAGEYILDVGFETMRLFNTYISSAATVIWNGPLGMTELPQFVQSSEVLATAIAQQYGSLTSVIGGGDTADFVLDWQESHKTAQFSHISTGGGASLELMSGQKLPGIEALIKV